MNEDDDKADGEPFAKLQVPEEAIRKHDEDVEREREGPRVNHYKEGHAPARVLSEVPGMHVGLPWDHPPGALRGL